MSDAVRVLACEIANESDADFESRPLPQVEAEFKDWLTNKRRARDQWASIVGRLLLLEALRTLGARDIGLCDLGRRDDHSPIVPHPFCGSISHTAEVVVAVAAAYGAIGVDVESDKLTKEHSDRIQTSFSKEERMYLNGKNATAMFAWLWTRKEALVKATGCSLDEVLRVSVLEDQIVLNSRSWYLQSLRLDQMHHCSIAWDHRPLQLKPRMLAFSSLAP